MHELQLSSANTGWAPVFLQTNEITLFRNIVHEQRKEEGEMASGDYRAEKGAEDGETVAKGDPRVSQIFLRDRLSNLPTRCAVEFRQDVD